VVTIPSTEGVSVRMARQKTRDTACELVIRRCLHRSGFRYFTHRRPVQALRREADIVFPRLKVAVFVDGCFWHGCPVHGTWPKANSDWWRAKIEANRLRDSDTDRRLSEMGWRVVRIWEHEDPEQAALRIAAVVRNRRRSG
jgi:DNA mismatch endonuclease (patch repair protein)